MIRLLGAELNRLLSRRFTVITLLVVLLVLGGAGLLVRQTLKPPSADQVTAGQRAYQQSHDDWVQHHAEQEQACVAQGGTAADCAYPEPKLDDYVYRPSFDDGAPIGLRLVIYLTTLAAFLIAGSFIGAEFSSGSIGNWLSFVPQRLRVYSSKLLVVTVFCAVVAALGSAAILAASVVFSRGYGIPVTGLNALIAVGGRGIIAVVVGTVGGFCLGLLSRHTAAAVGVLVGYLFVWFVRNGLLAGAGWAQRLTPWTPEGNLSAIIDKGSTYYVPQRVLLPDGGFGTDTVEHTITFGHGLAYWAVLVVILLAVSAVVFRRRDVN